MVRAAVDLELQAMTCERFLPAVTGFPPGAWEAEASVVEMLDRFSRDGGLAIKATINDIDAKFT
jgi:hypothetical protein